MARLPRPPARPRCAALLLALSAVAVTPRGGRAQDAGDGRAAGEAGAPAPPPSPGRLGAAVTLGVPAGLGVTLAARPFHWLQLGAGVEHNSLAPGVHAEAILSPFRWRVRPTLGLLAGRGFHADASRFSSRLGIASRDASLLRGVDYTWAAVELGAEVGPPRGLGAFARAGVGMAWGRIPHFEERLQASNPSLSARASDPRLRLTFPALTVGLVYWR